jgi:hypothetical protein
VKSSVDGRNISSLFDADALRLPEDACPNWKGAWRDYNQRLEVLKAVRNRLTITVSAYAPSVVVEMRNPYGLTVSLPNEALSDVAEMVHGVSRL